MITDDVIAFALSTTGCYHKGHHHLRHWVRVHQFGNLIGLAEGADMEVVSYFAFLHDAARNDDTHDRLHGQRMANLLKQRDSLLENLTKSQRSILITAIAGHSAGTTSSEPTIGTCWDADRMDLSRLGITPAVDLMSTDTGKAAAELGEIW